MSYSRKRASVACNFCRQRKRRCDGRRPICGYCIESNAECQYQELSTERYDARTAGLPASLSRRLGRIESLLESHAESIGILSQTRSPIAMVQSPAVVATSPEAAHATPPAETRRSAPSIETPAADVPEVPRDSLLPLTIPPKHQTSTNSLLGLDTIKTLVGEFPDNYFFRIESQSLREEAYAGTSLTPPCLDRPVMDDLVAAFFSHAHSDHPIIDRESFLAIFERVAARQFETCLETGLCLVVLALGAISSHSPQATDRDPVNAPGFQYFQAALQILIPESTWSFGSTLILPQALIFASLYFAYLARPLHSWKLVHLAANNIQLYISQYGLGPSRNVSDERIRQICWSCFLIECDRLAEFNLPRSGIELLVDDMAFPSAGHPPDTDHLYYLAEISVRRLLNRVHDSLYSHDGGSLSSSDALNEPFRHMSLPTLVSITSELDRQLCLWYDNIPDIIKPTLGSAPIVHPRQRILRTRFYAAKHIIHRPFVLCMSSIPEGQEPPSLAVDRALTCITSCRLYLQHAGDILRDPSPYSWTLSQSSLGAILVLTIASLSRFLKDSVPDLCTFQQNFIDTVSRLSAPDSSLESAVAIVQDIKRKQRFL